MKKKWHGASVDRLIHAKMELNAYKSIQNTSKGRLFNILGFPKKKILNENLVKRRKGNFFMNKPFLRFANLTLEVKSEYTRLR